ncbi:MAG: drug:proton antiporter [Rhizobium sp.]|nr:drug:proton antiporter [Rhizobium sp.]
MIANYNLLYVDNAPASRDFYARLLDLKPVEDSGNFVLFILPNGIKFGLWNKHDVKPAANQPGGFELGLPVGSDGEVDQLAADWKARGISIIQEPETMDFGRTFTALDPDGHRLRVLHLDMGR